MQRKDLLKPVGAGQDRVRLYVEQGRVFVRWYRGRWITKSWEDTSDNRKLAKQFFRGVVAKRTEQYVCLTLKQLWDRYVEYEFDNLRPKTQLNYSNRWMKWMRFVGHNVPVDDTSIATVDEFRVAFKGRNVLNQVRAVITVVKIVYRWGAIREFVRPNLITDYQFKMPKGEGPAEPDEYTADEYERIVAQLDPRDSRKWRASTLVLFLGVQGVRQNAALHLKWDDVDLETMTVTWRADTDKMGREWTQPIRRDAYAALLTAQYWAEQQGRGSPFVWYSPKDPQKPFGAQGFWKALKAFEAQAGVPHRKGRSAHGLRKMVAGDAQAATDNPLVAMRFIGDRDPRRAKEYLKERDTMHDVAEAMDQ